MRPTFIYEFFLPIAKRMVIIKKITESATLISSEMGKANQMALTSPERDSRYAAGMSTTSWRPMLTNSE